MYFTIQLGSVSVKYRHWCLLLEGWAHTLYDSRPYHQVDENTKTSFCKNKIYLGAANLSASEDYISFIAPAMDRIVRFPLGTNLLPFSASLFYTHVSFSSGEE